MGKIIQFPKPATTPKLGHKRVRKRKRVDLEEFGQLNMFEDKAKVISIQAAKTPFEEALELDEKGDDRAVEAYLKAISIKDCVEDSYCNLGALESQKGNNAKAINYFTLCLKNEPRHFEAHYNLANVYSEIQDYSLAKVHYEIAIEIDPEFANNYYNLAIVYISHQDWKTALEMLKQYKRFAPLEDHDNANELINNIKRSTAFQA